MNCKTAHRLMYLTREGERSQEDGEHLARHLAECPACLEEARGIPDADARLRGLLGSAPPPAHPFELRDAVLRRIADGGAVHAMHASRPHALDRWPARIAAAAAVVLLLGSLLFHLYALHDDLSRFERSMAARAGGASPAEVVYAVRSEDVTEISSPALQSLLSMESALPHEGTLRFSRGELQRIYGKLAFMPAAARRVPVENEDIRVLLDAIAQKLYLTIRTGDEGGQS